MEATKESKNDKNKASGQKCEVKGHMCYALQVKCE